MKRNVPSRLGKLDAGEKSRASVGVRRSEATEQAVLDATAALLAEEGYGALSM